MAPQRLQQPLYLGTEISSSKRFSSQEIFCFLPDKPFVSLPPRLNSPDKDKNRSVEKSVLIRFAIILALVMGATWLSLSGYFTNMLLTLGVISILFVLWMCSRMAILDKETAPYLSLPLMIPYFFWLFKEIVKANVAVVKAVLSPELEVSPTMTKIPYASDADVARTMFANSITLTPGTVSVNMEDDHILVHALLKEMSKPEDFVEMGEQSAWSIGEGKRS